MMGAAALAVMAWADPDAAGLERAWRADLGEGDAYGALSGSDFSAIAAGDYVVHRMDTSGGVYGVAAVWIPQPIEVAWVTVQDGRDRPVAEGVDQEWLPGATAGARKVYMRLDLPWPVADRQWIADMVPDADLMARTDGRVWRFSWTLGDPALAVHPDPAAVWVDENRGGWTLVRAEGGTICVLTVRTLVGGSIPASISQTFARATLKATLRRLAELAPGTAAHYSAGHPVVQAPDGTPVQLATR